MTWGASRKRHLLAAFFLLFLLTTYADATTTSTSSKGPLYIRVRITATFPLRLVPNVPSTLQVDNTEVRLQPGHIVDISFTSPGFTVRVGDYVWQGNWVTLTPNEMPPAILPSRIYGSALNGGTTYRARMEALVYGGVPYLVNVVPMNDYLYGVLASEMPVNWPIESLKAQAIAARTYALHHLLYRDPADLTPWDICDTQDCQAYTGSKKESLSTYDAVRSTDREVLVYTGSDLDYRGKLIDAVFHSTSPGHTYNSEDVWGSVRPYLRGRDDSDYSRLSPWFQWSKTVSITIPSLAALLGMKQIHTLTPVLKSGEIRSYTAQGTNTSRTFTKEQLRKWYHLPSPTFDLKTSSGTLVTQSTSPGNILTVVNGRGYGHGVGMSQYGAKTMAEQGWNYGKILRFYYTDVSIEKYNLSGMRRPVGYPAP